MTDSKQGSYSGIMKSMRVLVSESVYEDAQVTVNDGQLFIEFAVDDLPDIMISLDALGIRPGRSCKPTSEEPPHDG
jgi:hypothetical protein